ncbi:MAG: helix-hairpin-helix domain-containing protein [Anaerohalosphaeraceae bacterium]|nr:helix-hairpin-helix domain-containing protein [Anaerohalosphaeraceae bacterium]
MEPYKIKAKGNVKGSALILTVVLTVLLSIVGVMFIMTSRMDNLSTSAVADTKTLDCAIDSVIELISEQLVLDSPGVADDVTNLDYYDYPDVNNAFLASIEPYEDSGSYYWRQISDVTGFLKDNSYAWQNVDVDPPGVSQVIRQYPEFYPSDLDASGAPINIYADADGDGIADAKWILLDNIRSEKGKPLYAAIRIIDNSGLLNINTAYQFDASSLEENKIDGSTQMQINLAGLFKDEDADGNVDNELESFQVARYGGVFDDDVDWPTYNQEMVWNSGLPNGLYDPYDITDELELRYRYCLDNLAVARIESEPIFDETFDHYGNPGGYYKGSTNWGLGDWGRRITDNTDTNWDRRHLFTTINLDRVIDPDGDKMFSIEATRGATAAQDLYDKMLLGIDIDGLTYLTPAEKADRKAWLAQIVANLIDGTDGDAEVTTIADGSDKYYGFERPFIYLSEITRNFTEDPVNPPLVIHKSYAIELRKNFRANDDFPDGDWTLEISDIKDNLGGPVADKIIPINAAHFNDGGGEYYVHIFEDPLAPLANQVDFSDSPEDGATGVDPDIVLRWGEIFLGYNAVGTPVVSDSYDVYFGQNPSDVENATTTVPLGVLVSPPVTGQAAQSYDPGGLPIDTEYFWRVDGRLNPANPAHYSKGSVWSFETWNSSPETVEVLIAPMVFNAGTTFRLYRDVDGVPILVDEMDGLAFNFCDTATAVAGFDSFASYQRDIRWELILKRLWGETNATLLGLPVPISPTLGHENDFEYNHTVGLTYRGNHLYAVRPYHGGFDNVGEIAQLFRKTNYLEGNVDYQISAGDREVANRASDDFPRIDMHDRVMQKMFQYITLFDPAIDDATKTAIKGRVNINTAPISVIKQLPWVTDSRFNRDNELAEAIVAFRDKKDAPINYSNRFSATDITDISEAPGFSSIGELAAVITDSSGDIDYRIDYYGIDGVDQFGYPDLSTNRERYDGYVDDLEEQNLIFARISDLVTVRSDIFTAYILVRLGAEGPQKRVLAILDRSGVKNKSDKVRVIAYQVIPDIK